MQKLVKITLFLTLLVSVIATGCSTSKKGGHCGCPAKTGFIGY